MNIIEHKITLDILESSADTGIAIPQSDSARTLLITLLYNREPYTPPENSRAVFTALKPDGAVIFNAAAVDGSLITYPLTAQTTAAAGVLRCQLRLYGYDGQLLISPGFSLLVTEAVYNEGDEIESRDEVTALTSLITDTHETLDTIRQNLTDGGFIPQFSVGSVTTLPHGQLAAVELTGSKAAPVLNFAIPQGAQGQAESIIADPGLDPNSTKPVQNTVITAALNEKLSKTEFELSSKEFVNNSDLAETLSNFVEKEEIGNYLETKVDKVSGMALSSNDFTDAEKSKLSGIAAGANNYSLPALGVGTGHLAKGAVTREKLAGDALYSPQVLVGSSRNIAATDLGCTLQNTWNVSVTYTLTQAVSAVLPTGAEIAFLKAGSSQALSSVIAFSGVRAGISGDDTGYKTSPSFAISDYLGVVAIRKIAPDATNGDLWVVIGNVEVLA